MKKNKVFIGMPVFNGEKFIAHAIESFLSQTYSNWHLLISDNCSTDNTYEICRKFSAADSRIEIAKQKRNIGAAENFKFVFDRADSDFFMWAACDDHWAPDYLKNCVSFLNANKDVGMVFTNLFTFDDEGKKRLLTYNLEHFSGKAGFKNSFSYFLGSEESGKANLVYGLFRRELLLRSFTGLPVTLEWGSDMELLIRFLKLGGVKILPSYFFGKRQLPNLAVSQELSFTLYLKKLKNFWEYGSYISRSIGYFRGSKYFIPSIFVGGLKIIAKFIQAILGPSVFKSKKISRCINEESFHVY
jgi:glycosyltransferase involved in cell wall biosynthesis